MRIEPRHVVRLVVVVGIAAVFVFALWLPHRRLVLDKREQIRSQETRLAHLREEAAPVAVAPNVTSDNDHEGRAAVPDRSDLGSFLERLSEDLAAESAEVQQLQANAIEEGSDYNRIPVSLHFSGSHSALYGLLRRIESTERIIRVDHLEVACDPTEAEHPLRVKIELSTFSLASRKASS